MLQYEKRIDFCLLKGEFHICLEDLRVDENILKKLLEKYNSAGWYTYTTVTYGGKRHIHFENNINKSTPISCRYEPYWTFAERLGLGLTYLGLTFIFYGAFVQGWVFMDWLRGFYER